MMIHKIHTGANLEANFNQDYIVVGYRRERERLWRCVRFGSDFDSQHRRPLSGHGSHRLGRGHGGMLHVPRRRFGGRAADRQERGNRPAGSAESVAGHDFGVHGLPSQPVGAARMRKPTPTQGSAKAATFVTAPAPLSARRRSTRGCETAARLQAIPCRK